MAGSKRSLNRIIAALRTILLPNITIHWSAKLALRFHFVHKASLVHRLQSWNKGLYQLPVNIKEATQYRRQELQQALAFQKVRCDVHVAGVQNIFVGNGPQLLNSSALFHDQAKIFQDQNIAFKIERWQLFKQHKAEKHEFVNNERRNQQQHGHHRIVAEDK